MSRETFAAWRPQGPLTLIPLSRGGGRPAGALPAIGDDRDAFAVFAPADGLAPPGFERIVRAWTEARPDADLFYGDDVALGETDRLHRQRLKPSFDVALLAAQDYIGAPLIVRASALARLGGVRAEMGEAGLYDLVLRAEAAGLAVARIPHLLLAWPGRRPEIAAEARRRALADWIGPRPLEVADGLTPETLQLRRRFDDHPPVTLVIPTGQGGAPGREPFVVQLLDSLAGTDWPMDRLSVLVGDDCATADTFAPGRWPFAVERVATPRPPGAPFDYAAKMNRLWRMARTEHLVLMNDDVQALSPGWLKALMTFAMDRDVGGVGARLLFPDGRLQHAGVIGGLWGSAVHGWFGVAGDAPTYQDWTLVHREWSMVTGAVFATRRSAMEAANGFEPRFTLEFNDVDLCLRMRLLGLRIVYTPFAEMTHRERASRGDTRIAGEEVALFHNRWRGWLADDPAYHPRLTRDRFVVEPAEDETVFDAG